MATSAFSSVSVARASVPSLLETCSAVAPVPTAVNTSSSTAVRRTRLSWKPRMRSTSSEKERRGITPSYHDRGRPRLRRVQNPPGQVGVLSRSVAELREHAHDDRVRRLDVREGEAERRLYLLRTA